MIFPVPFAMSLVVGARLELLLHKIGLRRIVVIIKRGQHFVILFIEMGIEMRKRSNAFRIQGVRIGHQFEYHRR